MSFLNIIVEKKKERLENIKTSIPLKEIKSGLLDIEEPRNFRVAIKRDSGPVRVIAEIKRASPSRGIIRQDFNVGAIALIYEDSAVNAISVLTEEDYFQGKLDYLQEVKRITRKPILRKDFIFDEYQIYESRMKGADAILLIASMLGRSQAAEYLHLSSELGLSVLFEVHDFDEIETALLIDTDIIAINNRDLKTLNLDINTTFELKKEIPLNKIIVSESGIKNREDVKRIEEADIDSILIGTTLMEAEDIGKKIKELMGREL
ncbi:MAG: indole-3-glycerol phosphate synthase TrpC [Nitrospirota bacterium]